MKFWKEHMGLRLTLITAFFVGMGNYFGNAENVGPRVLVAVFMLLSLLAELIAAFMRRVKGCPVKVQG